MKKDGFTLVELLGIIIMIGIVGGIIIPSSIKLLEKSRIKAFEVSVEGYIKAIDTDNTERGGLENTYEIIKGDVFHQLTKEEVNVSNSTEENGLISINKDGIINGTIVGEKYCVIIENSNKEFKNKENCSI